MLIVLITAKINCLNFSTETPRLIHRDVFFFRSRAKKCDNSVLTLQSLLGGGLWWLNDDYSLNRLAGKLVSDYKRMAKRMTIKVGPVFSSVSRRDESRAILFVVPRSIHRHTKGGGGGENVLESHVHYFYAIVQGRERERKNAGPKIFHPARYHRAVMPHE